MTVVTAGFDAGERVRVGGFFARPDGDGLVTLGDPRRGVFVSVPEPGLEILRVLQDGGTVGDARAAFELACEEPVQLEELNEFLGVLARKGFLAPLTETARDPVSTPAQGRGAVVSAGRVRVGRMLFGGWALLGYGLVICVGLALIVADPAVIPAPHVLLFDRHASLMLGLLLAVTAVAIVLHEGAHVLAAWAAGVPARVGIGRRLWFVVFQTDISAIWLASKRERYVALIAGVLVDGVTVTGLVAVLVAASDKAISISPFAEHLLGAVLFGYLLRLLWQCFVFVRTDFYFVLATWLGAKRLLGDTEDLLRNQLARLRRRPAPVDQSAIPASEMRAVRGYAWVWIAGHLLALASLGLITVPVLHAYITDMTSGQQSTAASLLGAGVGLLLWGCGLAAFTLGLIRQLTGRTPPVTRK